MSASTTPVEVGVELGDEEVGSCVGEVEGLVDGCSFVGLIEGDVLGESDGRSVGDTDG